MDTLIQLMAWNPDASSLQPIVKKGFVIHLVGRFRTVSVPLSGRACRLFQIFKECQFLWDERSLRKGKIGKGEDSENEKKITRPFKKVQRNDRFRSDQELNSWNDGRVIKAKISLQLKGGESLLCPIFHYSSFHYSVFPQSVHSSLLSISGEGSIDAQDLCQ